MWYECDDLHPLIYHHSILMKDLVNWHEQKDGVKIFLNFIIMIHHWWKDDFELYNSMFLLNLKFQIWIKITSFLVAFNEMLNKIALFEPIKTRFWFIQHHDIMSFLRINLKKSKKKKSKFNWSLMDQTSYKWPLSIIMN